MESLTEAQQRLDCQRSYAACIRALRLHGIREGRFTPIQTDKEEMEAAREVLDR